VRRGGFEILLAGRTAGSPPDASFRQGTALRLIRAPSLKNASSPLKHHIASLKMQVSLRPGFIC